ncbi:unnamed protein product [Pocillopora meandrina]|uniref:Uncharacterized protein n=1 Tax=Pocillopora meandrina TaxID=46732 RepID=A0AAU9X2P1_9CNID|nr:unnamed protein product [Pocillopora meandrina]
MRGGRTCRQDARSTPSRGCGVIHPNVVHQFLQLRHFPRGYEVNATTLSWCFVAAGILATVLFFGSKVNEKIHSFQSILQTMPVSTAEEAKVLLFLLDLQGEPKGLSIGGLLVITKSTSLAIAGVIVSYFAVLLSLPR